MEIIVEMVLTVFKIGPMDECVDTVTCDDETVGSHVQHMILKYGKNIRIEIRPV